MQWAVWRKGQWSAVTLKHLGCSWRGACTSKSDTAIRCKSRGRLSGSFLYCACSCWAKLWFKKKNFFLNTSFLRVVDGSLPSQLIGYELASIATSSAALVGKSPMSVFSGSFFSRSVSSLWRHICLSSAWLGMSEPSRRIWLELGWAVGCAFLRIYSAVHTAPLLSGWQAVLAGLSQCRGPFHDSTSCHLLGQLEWERVEGI